MALALAALAAAQPPATVTVNWTSRLAPLRTVAAFQTVVNPVTTRESPYHDAVYEKISSLGAPFQRYGEWGVCGVQSAEPPPATASSRGSSARS